MTTVPDDTTLLHRLAEANDFDLSALPDNRAGHLSAAQARALGIELRAARRNAWIPKVIAVGIAVFLAYLLATDDISVTHALLVCALLVGMAYAGWFAPAFGTIGKDIEAGRVVSADGEVRRQHSPFMGDQLGAGSTDYYYRLGKLSFEVCGAGYNALVEGRRYRVYYLPDTRADQRQMVSPLVNIEPLPDLPPEPERPIPAEFAGGERVGGQDLWDTERRMTGRWCSVRRSFARVLPLRCTRLTYEFRGDRRMSLAEGSAPARPGRFYSTDRYGKIGLDGARPHRYAFVFDDDSTLTLRRFGVWLRLHRIG